MENENTNGSNLIFIQFNGLMVQSIIEMEPMQEHKTIEIVWQIKIVKTGRIVLKFSNAQGIIFKDSGLDTTIGDILETKIK